MQPRQSGASEGTLAARVLVAACADGPRSSPSSADGGLPVLRGLGRKHPSAPRECLRPREPNDLRRREPRTGVPSRCNDFAGCTPGDDMSCDAACAELETKVARDEAAVFDAEVRHATCDPSSCLCRIVIRVADRCYTRLGPFATAYDCSLGVDAILSAAAPLPAAAPSASTGVDEAVPTPIIRADGGALACEQL